MTSRFDSIFLEVVVKAMVPLIQVFAFYVITHGHYSPGAASRGG
jgi:multisubunit Na+/H+ antiporter MnhB subunit